MLCERSSRLHHANQGVRSSSDQLHKRGTHSKGIASIYLCHPEDVCAIFFEHVKLTRNMVGDEVAKGLAKFSQNSKYQPTTFATTHPTTPSPSATPTTSATQPSYGMTLNYLSGQISPAHKTAMTIYTPRPIPISSMPTLAIPDQGSIMPPIVPPPPIVPTATPLARLDTLHHTHPPII
jgi:hypothetical protein